ncbi:hypothetical protein ACP70R_026272 [Stipagrostis hirtigluma subsp. patula]
MEPSDGDESELLTSMMHSLGGEGRGACVGAGRGGVVGAGRGGGRGTGAWATTVDAATRFARGTAAQAAWDAAARSALLGGVIAWDAAAWGAALRSEC